MEQSLDEKKSPRKIRNLQNHNCFGCSPHNDKGLRMEFYADDDVVFTQIQVPAHCCGWDNLVHGGVISTIMDEVMSWTAIYRLKSFILTKTMTVDFLRPVLIGKNLRAEGRVLEVKSDREAVIEAVLLNDKGRECARSRALFATFSADTIKNLGFMNKALIAEFEEIMKSY
ncbi:MAG TPA: PaaI family thioesterase [Spirochaetota bacterium]|nr:PaaI family thioesterase [Spirochaetota bacterium]HPI90055.1 PaaI family thioesterase [Spirochaetota bacterium]HPR47842.1 PaaI family thioesterase [Spirochaetota bacterium]